MRILGGKNNPFLFEEFWFEYVSILGTDQKTHAIIQAHVCRGLWLDLMMLFGSMRGTIGNLGGKALWKASAVVFFSSSDELDGRSRNCLLV